MHVDVYIFMKINNIPSVLLHIHMQLGLVIFIWPSDKQALQVALHRDCSFGSNIDTKANKQIIDGVFVWVEKRE